MQQTNTATINITNKVILKAVQSLKERNFDAEVLETKEEALSRIKELIPAGSSVMNGASKTLEQIGFTDYLKSGQHGWIMQQNYLSQVQ